MTGAVKRRAVLIGGLAALAAPRRLTAAGAAASARAILEASGLGALSGFAVADLDSGALLEGHAAGEGRPPASVVKIVTSLYALETLGPEFRFRTRVLAAGAVEGGVLRGDLVLEGGGDPLFDTDQLGGLVAALRAGGLSRVEGRLLVAAGALPPVAEVARDQPEDAGYNPTLSGMNLNFNRVQLAWAPGATGPALVFGAPGKDGLVEVSGIGGKVAEGPIRHRFADGREIWLLPPRRVRGTGTDWLPVRAPAAHAGEVFARQAATAGLALPPAEVVGAASGHGLALAESPQLERMMREMLRFSTNLTAEAIGLTASRARGAAPDGLGASAAEMSVWARRRFGLDSAALVDHSGLGDGSRLAPEELLAVLGQAVDMGLPGLLRDRPVLGPDRKPVDLGVQVVAKTGTLYFASALAGYMTGRRRLAFAILAADPGLRARIRPEDRADPPGAKAWAGRARAQEQALLRHWAAAYAA